MKKRFFSFLALLMFTFFIIDCSPRMASHLVGAAIVTAAVVGTAHVIAHHDHHFHHYNCGCYREYHDGHWVYYYDGYWEYYDPYRGVWFRYY